MDGDWKYNPDEPSAPDNTGNINNYIDTTNVDSKTVDQKLAEGTLMGTDKQKEMDEEPRSLVASLGINLNNGQGNTKMKAMGTTTSKKSNLFGLQLDTEAPPLPPCFDGALFLNKKSQKNESLSLESAEYRDLECIMKLLDYPLAPPTHAEV